MTGTTNLTIVGNLTADPELRYTQNGLPVANFTIAVTPRIFDKKTNEWKDQETKFVRASVWRQFAENVAASLSKGTRVVATGNLKQRNYQDREGNQRSSMELEIDEIGASLKHATATVQRVQSGSGQPAGSWSVPATPAQSAPADTWATAQPADDLMPF